MAAAEACPTPPRMGARDPRRRTVMMSILTRLCTKYWPVGLQRKGAQYDYVPVALLSLIKKGQCFYNQSQGRPPREDCVLRPSGWSCCCCCGRRRTPSHSDRIWRSRRGWGPRQAPDVCDGELMDVTSIPSRLRWKMQVIVYPQD